MKTATSINGTTTHLTEDNEKTLCNRAIDPRWMIEAPRFPTRKATCKTCLNHPKAKSKSNSLTTASEPVVDEELRATVQEQSRLDNEQLTTIPRHDHQDSEGAYTQAHFIVDLGQGVDILDPHIFDINRLFTLTSMSGEDIRLFYYAVTEYKDNLLKEIRSDDIHLEDLIFRSGLVERLAKWQFDLEQKFGGPKMLNFAPNIVNEPASATYE